MTSLCIHHLILAGLIGIHSERITVSEVSVEAGGSISIPCLYELSYTSHVKYLCKGKSFLFCNVSVKTNPTVGISGRFSISDDTAQIIFTVTIHNLTDQDTYYWCAVEIKHNFDVKHRFQLLVTTGRPSLYVDRQEMAALEGGSVTILCHFAYPKPVHNQWCRLGSTCVTDQTGSISGAALTINSSVPNVFNVTMSELSGESSGWYWCASGNLQMPVHLTVHQLTSTTANFTGTLSTTTQHYSILTSAETFTSPRLPINSTIKGAGGEDLQDAHKISTKALILISVLVLLLLVVPAAVFGWRMIRRNGTKPTRHDITAGSQTGNDPDVLYATVVHNQHIAAQKKQNDICEASVTYSTIVRKESVLQMTEPAEGNVIYSSITLDQSVNPEVCT